MENKEFLDIVWNDYLNCSKAIIERRNIAQMKIIKYIENQLNIVKMPTKKPNLDSIKKGDSLKLIPQYDKLVLNPTFESKFQDGRSLYFNGYTFVEFIC